MFRSQDERFAANGVFYSQFEGVQGDRAFHSLLGPVFPIPHDRVPGMGKLYADLMAAPGDRRDLHK